MGNANKLLHFFSGGADDQGRSYDAILAWEDAALEQVHDYIQWIFPLAEQSGANPWAPTLDRATIDAIRASPAMQERLRAGFLRMLAFYGFTWRDGAVVEGHGFAQAARNWLHAGNHNHLRLTRILRSLRLLGLDSEASALWKALGAVHDRELAAGRRTISGETFAFWNDAATGALVRNGG